MLSAKVAALSAIAATTARPTSRIEHDRPLSRRSDPNRTVPRRVRAAPHGDAARGGPRSPVTVNCHGRPAVGGGGSVRAGGAQGKRVFQPEVGGLGGGEQGGVVHC